MQKFKDVRVFFSKTDECRFIGHLDINRIITRAIQKAKLPIWRTEGFNQHLYITFSNPLSLGFSSICESFDIRTIDDNFDIYSIPNLLNPYLPKGLRIQKAEYPKHKSSEITSALYDISMYSDDNSNIELYDMFKEMLHSEEIIVEKKTKKGFKEINLANFLSTYELSIDDENLKLNISLPSGGKENINPMLFIKKIEDEKGIKIYPNILRLKMMVEDDEFR